MRRLLAAVAVLIAMQLVTFASARAQQALVTIDVVDDPRPVEKWGYAPANRRVPIGSWVTWSNAGYEAHTVTAEDGTFDSGWLNPSEGFSWYFDHDGTYEYVCALHEWMVGKVVVGSGVAPDAPPPSDTPPPSDEPEPSEPSDQ